MFLHVARLRLVASTLLLLTPFAFAKEKSLFTSSVTYCEPPETLLIQQFDIAYIAANSSVSFNISAASVQPNVNVSANILVNIYGIQPVNFTLDLCSVFSGALCPLPMYNFTGVDSIALPSSIDVNKHIPGIAYQVPDLEAFAQLQLIEQSTGDLKACVQATLSNGWSMRQEAAEWSAGGIALLALASAVWQSWSPEALAPYRLLDLMYLYQFIGTSALLNLNYPSAYRAFAINFAWAMGLFESDHVQNSINAMRHNTGGDLADATGSAVSLVNRKLSPYNSDVAAASSSFASSISRRAADFVDLDRFRNLVTSAGNVREIVATAVATVTTASSNVLEAGVPIYVNSVKVATANAFMTVFLTALMVAAVALTALGLGYLGLLAAIRSSKGNTERLMEVKYGYMSYARAWCLRLCLIALSPILIFTFYQWTLKDSWASVLLSVLTLLFIAGAILYPTFLTMRLARRSTPYSLLTNPEHHASYGPLYGQYRNPRFYFFLAVLAAMLLKALFVAFAKANGLVQLVLMLIVEVFLLLAQIVLKPHKMRGGDVLGTYLGVVRVVSTGAMIAFLQELHVKAIPRVVIGIAIALILSVAVVVLFINTLVHLGVFSVFKRRRATPPPPSPQDSTTASMVEKEQRDAEKYAGSSESSHSRSTPERNEAMGPAGLHPEHQTPHTPTTGSTTLGEIIPSRWSFSHHNESPHSPYFVPMPDSQSQSHRPPTIQEHPRYQI
ncbi:hypothetical protein PLICRDRAFT_50692 [Plicaturopsis crispa FD-325 SS-3]|nr:hypothetical protein PLICRDRAFT_50692 [Plicaturopsis crispa FD-325 SS-3]